MKYFVITITLLILLLGISLDTNDILPGTSLIAKTSTDNSEVQFIVVSVKGHTSEITGYYKFSQVFNDTIEPLGLFLRINNIYFSSVETHEFGWIDVYSKFSSNRILYTPTLHNDYYIFFPPDSIKESSYELSDQIKTPEILSIISSDSVKGDSLWRRVAKTNILDSISMNPNYEVYVFKQNSGPLWFIIAQASHDPIGITNDSSPPYTNFNLNQNYPNPFNPVTTISYSLPVSGDVTLIIYNLRGEEVARLVDGFQQSGAYTTDWNASNVSSGIYFYRLQAGDFVQTRKMVLLK